jgi:hypothetical protein
VGVTASVRLPAGVFGTLPVELGEAVNAGVSANFAGETVERVAEKVGLAVTVSGIAEIAASAAAAVTAPLPAVPAVIPDALQAANPAARTITINRIRIRDKQTPSNYDQYAYQIHPLFYTKESVVENTLSTTRKYPA